MIVLYFTHVRDLGSSKIPEINVYSFFLYKYKTRFYGRRELS